MNEDDTFRVLRRTPISEMTKLYRDASTSDEKMAALKYHGWSLMSFLKARDERVKQLFKEKWDREGYYEEYD